MQIGGEGMDNGGANPGILGGMHSLRYLPCFVVLSILMAGVTCGGKEDDPLAVGVAGHAFDHLGGIADQAQAAADSGARIIYTTGFGTLGYSGLPPAADLSAAGVKIGEYVRHAKAHGIRLAIGYLCATSIVKIDAFDHNWAPDLRAQFHTPPRDWLQQGNDGKPLASWYGGDYRPACMNNPDWRTYEKFMVRQSLEAGMDGIFFDNPTVHPHGCYCRFCMEKFAKFLSAARVDVPANASVGLLRKLAVDRSKDFLRFRGAIAADFLGEMRQYARTIKPTAQITCNNSLNSPEAFFSQCRTYGYNIHAMSAAEDLVVVEDMASQPRILAGGNHVVEYGPVYEMLHAISHDKPIVAVTIAEGDYTTPPNLCRLAMAEAAAHEASYLSWPTWPTNERARMSMELRQEADFLRQHADILNGTQIQADVLVYLPFERWVETADCQALGVVRTLSGANVQYRVICEDQFEQSLKDPNSPRVLILESPDILTETQKHAIDVYQSAGGKVVWSGRPNWFKEFNASSPSLMLLVDAKPAIRAVVREMGNRKIVHLLNLNVERLSSFEDRVIPAANVHLVVRYRGERPTSVIALSADAAGTARTHSAD